MKKFFAILILVLVGFFLFIFTRTPSLNRDWAEDSKILPSVSIDENVIEIKNIRDWRYAKNEILSKDYYDETFDLNKLESTYYLINPFGKWDGIAHGFFLFVFEDGKSVSVSIEARREASESFNSVKGLFNKYELWYAYGSAADFITRRAVHYEDSELNMYPLWISKEMSQKLFLDLANETQSLEKEARFYNTIKSNCTNLLMDSLNKAEPGIIPFHYSRLFTGYSDDYFYKLGLIPNDQSFEEIKETHRIDYRVADIDKTLSRYYKDKYLKYSKEEFWDYFYRESYNPKNVDKEISVSPDYKVDKFGVPHPSSELISYVNNEWGIEFKYPSNYSVENSFDKNRINVLYPSFVARDGLGSVSIFLTTMDYQNFKDSLNKPEDYSKIIEEKEFVIDNKKGTMLVHTTAIGLDKSVVFIEHEGKNFLINYPNHPVQQEIFNSINFI